MSTLRQLAELVGGQLHGDGDIEIVRAATIRDARAGDLTLADHARLASQLEHCRASAVVAGSDYIPSGWNCIEVDDIHAAFAKIVDHLHPLHTTNFSGISPEAQIAESARIDEKVSIAAGVTIGEDVVIEAGTVIHAGCSILNGAHIGADSVLFPNVVVYEDSRIGKRAVIHAGCVIGAYGFGFHFQDGAYIRSAQLGYVEIGDDVEIGAGTTIDRGTYTATTIGEGTKIDNLVMIAHNCRIGRHNIICSQVGIAGSCSTGDYVVIAGQVGIRDHVDIGDQVRLGAKAGVASDVPSGQTYLGIPAMDERRQKHILASLSRLPELRKQVRDLQRILDRLADSHVESHDEPHSDAA